MSFVFRCPHCGTETEVEERYSGQTGPCAVCGKQVTVPYAESPTVGRGLGRDRGALVSIPVILGVSAVGLLGAATIIGLGIVMLAPVVQTARNSAQTIQCSSNLKQIALALQAYAEEHGTFPPAYLMDKNNKPIHSWRVLILPYLGQESLYKQYDFTQPWDSPSNQTLMYLMPEVYSCATDPDAAASQETNYMLIVGRRTVFPPASGTTRIDQITDGLADTLLVVETTNEAVCWMQPQDLDTRKLQFELNSGRGEPGSRHPGGAHIATADGEVHFLKDGITPDVLRALSTIAGGEPIPWRRIEDP